jgi:transposase-like protein
MLRIEITNTRYNKIYYSCKSCGSSRTKQLLLRAELDKFDFLCKKCKTTKTCLEKYGVDHISKIKNVRERTKQTCLKRYGVETPFENREVREKFEQTCLEKYGVSNPNKIKEVRNKIKNTSWKKYGNDMAPIVEKRKNTFLRKYGVINPNKLESVKEEKKLTYLKRYGVDNPAKNEKVKEKTRQTCIERYGVDHPWKNSEISKKLLEKGKKTLLERYGVDHNMKVQEFHAKTVANGLVTKKLNHTFNSSKSEDKFYEILKLKYVDVERQYSYYRYPFYCDFYIPEKDLFIELNEFWTHGKEAFDVTNNDHIKKMNGWQEKAKTSKFYQGAIETWTIRDVKKRKCAKENNINYIEIFGNHQFDLV